jgi:type IV secretory pathway protease TraF
VATLGTISRAEAEGWIDRLRSAWERKDVNALREMGEVPSGQEAALAKALGAYKAYHVDITVASVVIEGNRAQVTFDRTDSDETGRKLSHPRRTVHLERGPGGGLVVSR